MSTPIPQTAGDTWVEEGRRAASALDAVSSAVVVGRDPEAAAYVALGIARAQAERRRVAVADLVGEVPPLQSLVNPESDPHGISDSFLYGVSLNKIAHEIDASGNLFVLPSGSEAVAIEEVFASDRWRRLASGFREVGALLLLVAQADTPGLDALATSVDGVVIAGDASGALADAPAPLAVIAPVRRRGGRAPADAPAPNDARAPRRPVPPTPAPASPSGGAWRRWLALAILAVLVSGALIFWVFPRRTSEQGDVPRRADSTRAAAPNASDSAGADSAGADSASRAPGVLAPLAIANPQDSTNAVLWSVALTQSNTPEGVAMDQRTASTFAAVALTPVLEDGGVWYQLFVGAYASRTQADSLLAAMHERGLIGERSGSVERTPFALLIEDRVPAADAPARVQALAQKNVPVYPLSRGDGTVALYAGAFKRPQDAAWLSQALKTAGVTHSLVYRTGRSL